MHLVSQMVTSMLLPTMQTWEVLKTILKNKDLGHKIKAENS